MKKIAIVTMHGYYNYGNRWQNYAVQEILNKLGFEAETIVAKRSGRFLMIKNLYFSLLGKAKGKRYFKIRKFSKDNIKERKLIYRDYAIPENKTQEYEFFVAGSDQIWNPNVSKGERRYYFLGFVQGKQRVCLSPSFGVEEIPQEYQEEYREALNGFKFLCCRERRGIQMIKELTRREAEWLIDPTLALDKTQWHKLFPKTCDIKEKYILLAILGNVEAERMQYIQTIAKQNDMQIVDVLHGDVALDPGEVLCYLEHASLVYTDSFHFTAFSINFNTPFVVFKRQGNDYETNMFSRLDSLLGLFGLEERASDKINQDVLFECDFTEANQVLENERQRFFDYLNKCLLEDNVC